MTSPPDELARAVGRRLAARRTAANISQSSLAQMAHVSDGYIPLIEAGLRLPKLPALVRLAHAVGCDLCDLLCDDIADEDDDDQIAAAS